MLRLAQVMTALVKLPLLSSIWAHVPAEAIIAERDILLVLLWGEMNEQEELFCNLLKSWYNMVVGSMMLVLILI